MFSMIKLLSGMTKKGTLSITSICASLAICSVVHAEFTDIESVAPYSPAMVGGDKPLKLTPCTSIEPSANVSLGGKFRCDRVEIEAGSIEKNGRMGQFQINLNLDSKRRYRISGKDLDFGFLDTVHSVDLNGDGQPDYILEFSAHGVGLAAVRRTMVFLYSGSEYSWQTIFNLSAPAARHFYVSAEGVTTYLTSRLAAYAVSAMPRSSDGKQHTFWVFEPVVFSKANGLWAHIPSVNYPQWVQYKLTPSNKATELVSQATQKRVTLSPLKGARGGKMQPLS
jgi:hypothetical protein